MVLLSIRDIVIKFAQEYGLNTWDWIAVSVTLSTLLVSLISLTVACKTLKSQRKTEKNTAPDINPHIQFLLLEEFLNGLYESIYILFAFNYALIKTRYRTKPSHHFWYTFLNPQRYLHEEIFYDDAKKYQPFKNFISYCEMFYEEIEKLRIIVSDNKASNQEIQNEFDYIYGYVFLINHSTIEALKVSFELSIDDIVKCIKPLLPNAEVIKIKDLNDSIKDDLFYLEREMALSEFTHFRYISNDGKSDIDESLSEPINRFVFNISSCIHNGIINDGLKKGIKKDLEKMFSINAIRLSLILKIESSAKNIWYNGLPFYFYIYPEKNKTGIRYEIDYAGNYTLLDKESD